jgi:hypothetical protein
MATFIRERMSLARLLSRLWNGILHVCIPSRTVIATPMTGAAVCASP